MWLYPIPWADVEISLGTTPFMEMLPSRSEQLVGA